MAIYSVLDSELYFKAFDKVIDEFDATIIAAVLLDYNISILILTDVPSLRPYDGAILIDIDDNNRVIMFLEISVVGYLSKIEVRKNSELLDVYGFNQLSECLQKVRLLF